MYELFAAAGETAVEIARLVERRFREWPAGAVGQELVKDLEHVADRICSRILQTVDAHIDNPAERQDIVSLAFAVDEVPDKIESASELLGLYAVGARIYPATNRVTGIGWAAGVGRLGAVLGPWIAGLLVAGGMGMSGSFLVFAIPLAVAALCVSSMRSPELAEGSRVRLQPAAKAR